MSSPSCFEPDTLDTEDQDPTDSLETEAVPQLLDELARLLSGQKWIDERHVPRGVVNILNYSWHDLTAGALHFKSPEQTRKQRRSKGSWKSGERPRRQVSQAVSKRLAGERRSAGSERKPQGLIITQPQRPTSCGEPQRISVCQKGVEDGPQAARNPEKLQTAGQNMNKPLMRRHYGETMAKLKARLPEAKHHDPELQKLHYRYDDGSSFIYYPSGRVAVCQSLSDLPCGGFYTNVFSDSERPDILATITAFGCGVFTQSRSSFFTARWDQDGGFITKTKGMENKTKEWSWQTDYALKRKIVIQVSNLISVTMFSGTSAELSFKCNNECVQLPLLAVSYTKQSMEVTDGKFTSAPYKLMRTPFPGLMSTKRRMTLTLVSAPSREKLQMGRDVVDVKWLQELKKIRERAQKSVDGWLDCYRAAIGIKCPDTKRMPDAPLRTRPSGEVQSAALPSLNPPDCVDVKLVQSEGIKKEPQGEHKHLQTPTGRTPASSVRPRGTHNKEESKVIQVGPLKIHGNIAPESVIIKESPETQRAAAAVTPCPALPSFTPSVPLTVCPVLLRAALQGEGGRRRCCCSVTLMPVVTDLEYDTFVMGQPPHSQQILVVCVTRPRQHSMFTEADQEVSEQLYRKMNKRRRTPCTQCQMDSFRLVKYETSPGNVLLQQRHNAAPGMILMYIRGKLLFVGYIFSDTSSSVMDLQKQIYRTRGDYRLGLSLPPDFKCSDDIK